MRARIWIAAAAGLAALSQSPVATAADAGRASAPDCEQAETAPIAPPPGLAALVGQYGAPDAFVDVYEICGALYADGGGLAAARLSGDRASGFHAVGRDGAGHALAFSPDGSILRFDAASLARHDFGAEAQARITAAVSADPEALRRAALAAHPPQERPSKRTSDLISVPDLDPAIRMHSLYAGTDNFLGVPIYERAGAYLQRPAAEALVRVQRALRKRGYGLLITDAYRPWFATRMFWDATPPEDHIFVADPAQGSRHNRGCAVDLTLYDLATGEPVEMPGRIDEMSKRSAADYAGGTSRQRWLRALLRREMQAQGFAVYPYEWWHFDYKDWADYPIGTATYTELASGRAR